MSENFMRTLSDWKANTAYMRMNKCQYQSAISTLRAAALENLKKSRHDYYLLSKYEIFSCGKVDKLIKKRKNENDPILYYVPLEDVYSTILKAHVETGHGGRDKMKHYLSKKCANITRDMLEIFKSFCVLCQEKKNRPRVSGVVVKPILSSEFNSRAQVDLIDKQSSQFGTFKWILVYQCHMTKFVILRPLEYKQASHVAHQLVNIFTLFGAPSVLQSDNGREFTAKVIQELKILWPQLALVHGKPRHPQSQGSVERANADVKNMLITWLNENHTKNWVSGLNFVQHYKNTSYHSGIKMEPYKAMFGINPKVGLTSSCLPKAIIDSLESEEDLIALIERESNSSKESNFQSASLQGSVTFRDSQITYPQGSALYILPTTNGY